MILDSGVDWVRLFFDDDERGRQLTLEVNERLKDKIKVTQIDYRAWRPHYREKLDPGALLRTHMKLAVNGGFFTSSWFKF